MAKNSCAICFVTDANYMLPTMIAAIQARRATTVANAAVFVLALGLSPIKASQYGAICKKNNVQLVLVTRDIFGGDDGNAFVDAFFSGSKFTFGALGRLFLDQLVDPSYDQLLYVDGDVQFEGSLDPLINVELAPRTFLAAPDPKSFLMHEDRPWVVQTKQYMKNLGFSEDEYPRYFNSGVLRISRDGWKDIGLSAWEFLKSKPELCLCHDQSALNAVARQSRARMSIKWNFPPYYRYYGLQKLVNPRLIHFMSHPKPWNGPFLPWGRAGHQPYLDFVAEHPETLSDLKLFGTKLRLRYLAAQQYKRADEMVHWDRRRIVSAEASAYEATTVI